MHTEAACGALHLPELEARGGEHEHPWGWRIKIPLSGIGWGEILAAEKPGKCLVANVIGRRPHSSEAIHWRVEGLPDC